MAGPNEVSSKCPERMVLIKSEGAVHTDEPAFCIGKTEVPQEADNRFGAEKSRAGFELLIKLENGTVERKTDPEKDRLRMIASEALARRSDISGTEINPVVTESKPQPEGRLAGLRKPAVMRKLQEARDVCAGLYPGGDLPTEKQWENACGKGEYCTASGNLNHTEAIYDVNGPADVGSTPANPRGVQDMTGNVWEWMSDDVEGGYKRIRGGAWYGNDAWYLHADCRGSSHPDYRNNNVGFRCVAPPQD